MVGRAKLRTEGTLIGPPFTVTMSDHLSPEQRDRYARHLVLPGVGSEGQKKLLKSSVLVVGAGPWVSGVDVFGRCWSGQNRDC